MPADDDDHGDMPPLETVAPKRMADDAESTAVEAAGTAPAAASTRTRRIIRAIRPSPRAVTEIARSNSNTAEDSKENEASNPQPEEIVIVDDSEEDDDNEDDEDDEDEEDYYDSDEGEVVLSGEGLEDMVDVLRMISRVAGDDDDDDDDNEPCLCPQCILRRFAGINAHRDTNSESNNDSSIEDDDDSQVVADPNAPTCAICLEPETSKRSLVVLPCCGASEESSSTRFCNGCVCKCLKRNGISNRSGGTIGECPRCKHLLVANKSKLRKATTNHMLWYIGKKNHGSYRLYLVTLAWSYAQYLPMELLEMGNSSSQEEIGHLCQWRLLQKNGNVYSITDEAQKELRTWSSCYLSTNWDGDIKAVEEVDDTKSNRNRQCFMAACNCMASGWLALLKFKIGRCLRLWNRGMTLVIVASGRLLPNFEEWSHPRIHGWMASGLNVFFLYMIGKICVKAFWICSYVAVGYGTAQLMGSCMQAPPANSWKRKLRNAALTGLAVYSGYVGMLLYRGVFNKS